MNLLFYRHHDTAEALPPEMVESLTALLSNAPLRQPFSATEVRATLLQALYRDGWAGPVRLDTKSSVTVPAVKNSVALCFQSGNMGRSYADFLKLQLLYSRRKISGAIFLVFAKRSALAMGENLASYERVRKELTSLFFDIITVPLFVIGLEVYD
jgi:hypothetical protein